MDPSIFFIFKKKQQKKEGKSFINYHQSPQLQPSVKLVTGAPHKRETKDQSWSDWGFPKKEVTSILKFPL